MVDPVLSELRKQTKGLTRAVADLTARLAALEARAEDVERRHDVVEAAKANWRVVLRAQDRVVLSTDEGTIAVLPVGVAAVIGKDGALDLEVRDDGDQVALVDCRGADVATLPKGLVPVLSKVLATASIGTSSLGASKPWESQVVPRRGTRADSRADRPTAGAPAQNTRGTSQRVGASSPRVVPGRSSNHSQERGNDEERRERGR